MANPRLVDPAYHASSEYMPQRTARDITRQALKYTLVYGVFGVCWILATDWFALQLSHIVEEHTVQTLKGLFYVLTTAVLVFWLARRAVLNTENESLQEKLSLTENTFRATLRNLGEAVVLVDPPSRSIIEFNEAAESMFGYKRDEVLGKSTEILHINHQYFEHFGDIGDPDLAKHGFFQCEYQMKRKDGTVIDTENCVSVINEDFGQKGNVVSIIRDITDNKRAQEALQKSEEKYRLLADNTLDVIWAMGMDLRFTYANSAIERLMGYTPDEFIGSHLADFCDEKAYGKAVSAIEELGSSEREPREDGVLLEMEVLHKDGSPVPVEVHASALFGEEGQLVGVQGTTRDITERLESKQSLKASERRFRLLLEKTSEGVAVADIEQQKILYANPALAQMLGYTEEELARLEVRNIHPAENLGQVQAAFEQFSKGNSLLTPDIPCIRKNGEIIYTDINGTGMEIDGTRCAVGFFRNVTELRAAQRQQRVLLQRIKSLRRIDQMILSLSPLEIVLRQIAQETRETLNVDAVSILVLKEPQHRLYTGAEFGFSYSYPQEVSIHFDEGYVGRALMKREMVAVDDIQAVQPRFARQDMAIAEGFHGYACCPIVFKGSVAGVLEVFRREASTPDSEQGEFLQTLAGQAAIAMDNFYAFQKLQAANERLLLAYDSNIEGWSRALDYRDKETEGHSVRVTEITVDLARRAGMDDEKLRYVRWGALLHDIGKMGVPDHILLKPGKLTAEEWVIMKRHPEIARDLLRPISYLEQAIDIPYCHHEKWDGSGYPRGIKGKDIPRAARLFAVVDIWDALRSDRPYRAGWSERAVLEYLREIAGSQLDPELVELFCASVHEIPACSSPQYADK